MKIMNVAIVLAIVFATANAKPYSKYGRSCQDIGCRSDEKCIMAEEPCSYGHQRDQCGRYPTCQRINSGGESCTTKICSSGQYCRTENGRPTCVNTNAGLAYDSAGVSSVNGQRQPSGQQQPAVPLDSYGTRYANGNPYANANAPPADEVFGNNRYNNQPSPSTNSRNGEINKDNNWGYPADPSRGNNNGYPPNPPYGNSNGYPPYGNNIGYNNGHNNQNSGSSSVNNPKLNPGYNTAYNSGQNPGWGNTYPNSYRPRNGANTNGVSILLLLAMSIVGCLRIIKA